MLRPAPLFTVVSSLFLALGCATNDSTDDDGSGKSDTAGTTDVPLFVKEHVFFDEDPAMNRTTVDAKVNLPAQGTFKKVTLEFQLSCPEGNQCDHWDRPGALSFLDADGKAIEFGRFMTPYRLGGKWSVDVTDLQPVLKGPLTARVFIKTFVGPRINTQFGKGWIVDATLRYEAGTPERIPVKAVPVQFGEVDYGEPTKPTERTATIEVPEGVSSAGFYMLISGHGQGNLENCAEFCKKDHTVQLGMKQATTLVWRDDCDQNPINNQFGNWKFERAGWCPGDMVRPWREDFGAVTAGSHAFRSDVEAYENTCRPDSPVCSGCSLGNGCEYNGGTHVKPRWLTNGFVILYR